MIGIISDTHEQKELIQRAVKILKSKKVDLVIHCGDLISAGTIKLYQGLNVLFIFGNNDGDKEKLNEVANGKYGFERITETREFEYAKKKFFVCHGHVESVLDGAIKSKKYDYILTGHTHKKRDERIGRTRVINPGSLFTESDNTVALLDAKNDKLIFEKVE